MATVVGYYSKGGFTDKTDSNVSTSFYWVNGNNSSSTYCRSRIKFTYDNSGVYYSNDGKPYITVNVYLQMARSNGTNKSKDIWTRGNITTYFNEISTGTVYKSISETSSFRSNADANSYIPDSYFTTISSAYYAIPVYDSGKFYAGITVRASSSNDNMVINTQTFYVQGTTTYRYARGSSMSIPRKDEGGNYTQVWATCNVTDWGKYGDHTYVSDDYTKTAVLTKAGGTIEVDSQPFSSNSKVIFNVGAQTSNPDYDIRFFIDGPYSNSAVAYYADVVPFKPPSDPKNVKITYTPSNEEYTIVSKYTLSWNAPSETGSTGEFGYRVRVKAKAADGNNYYINLDTGDRSLTDVYKHTSSTSLSIPNSALRIGDTIHAELHSYRYFDDKYFWSGGGSIPTVSEPVGPILDDQAKVKLLDYNSQIVTGKVWVKDETGTWRKAKKIYVDTGTTSKNWEKSTNPTS